jgi:predicted  nucleic acid-binding Zn-ribbon protein
MPWQWPWTTKVVNMSNEFKVVVDVNHHFPVGQSVTDQILARLGKVEKKMSELTDKLDAANAASQSLTQAVDAEIQRAQDRVAKFNTQLADLQSQIATLQAMPQTPEVLAQIDALTQVMVDATAKVSALDITSPEVLPE